MGHSAKAKDTVYQLLAERLNRAPVGAPMTPTLIKILRRLYTEAEARLGSRFPLLPMNFKQVAAATGYSTAELKAILESMIRKGLVVDYTSKGERLYLLSPIVVGFFEYTFMRTRDDLDLKELSRLFEDYFNENGVREEVFGGGTKLFRALVYEHLISSAVETHVLSYEKASEIIRQAGGGALSMCACRHKASHLGKVCDAPVEDVCTALGEAGKWVVRQGLGRPATVSELLKNLERSKKLGLVLTIDNVLNRPAYLCHCCRCCCGVLRTINEAKINALQPSNFQPEPLPDKCSRCSTCLENCPVDALSWSQEGEHLAVNVDRCIGCGVCASACPEEALVMRRRDRIYTPPRHKKEQLFNIALEKGRLQEM
ncbi:MAG TPA: 4Fe-4S binding protein [Bacillota bacterium]|jgi:Pyruvate/2-oxoacid:ferredoxin oxidoreductase delta subunit/DNA-binding MarR family transcriptional regulator|nr:4Fe-4S binding protein [Bacillota bacterium]